MKYWRLSFREVMWGMSYQNVMMLNASIPKYDDKGNKIEPSARLSGRDAFARFKKTNSR